MSEKGGYVEDNKRWSGRGKEGSSSSERSAWWSAAKDGRLNEWTKE